MSAANGHRTVQDPYPELNYSAGPKWVKGLTQGRLGTFTGGHYSNVNLSSVLYHHNVDSQDNIKLQV